MRLLNALVCLRAIKTICFFRIRGKIHILISVFIIWYQSSNQGLVISFIFFSLKLNLKSSIVKYPLIVLLSLAMLSYLVLQFQKCVCGFPIF